MNCLNTKDHEEWPKKSSMATDSVAISLTIYRGHLGLSARSPKKVSKRVPGPLGSGGPKKS